MFSKYIFFLVGSAAIVLLFSTLILSGWMAMRKKATGTLSRSPQRSQLIVKVAAFIASINIFIVCACDGALYGLGGMAIGGIAGAFCGTRCPEWLDIFD